MKVPDLRQKKIAQQIFAEDGTCHSTQLRFLNKIPVLRRECVGGDLSILRHSKQTSSVPWLITPATYQFTVVSLLGFSLPSMLGDGLREPTPTWPQTFSPWEHVENEKLVWFATLCVFFFNYGLPAVDQCTCHFKKKILTLKEWIRCEMLYFIQWDPLVDLCYKIEKNILYTEVWLRF